MTSPGAITASLDRALAGVTSRVPARGGYAELDASTRGLELEAGHRLSDRWTLAGYASRSWQGLYEAGARARVTW